MLPNADDVRRTAGLPTCYAATFIRLTEAARKLGYALALHGSLNRDLDIVAVPWTDEAASAEDLAAMILRESSGFLAPHEGDEFPRRRPHGRLCWSIHLGGGPWIDLSVMPRITNDHTPELRSEPMQFEGATNLERSIYGMCLEAEKRIPTGEFETRLVETLRRAGDELQRLRGQVATGTNYVCDREVRPLRVEFTNGRVVALAVDEDGPYLEISRHLEAPASVGQEDVVPGPPSPPRPKCGRCGHRYEDHERRGLHCAAELCECESYLFPGIAPPERRMRGTRNASAKLTETVVTTIRSRVAAGTPQKDLAREFGVSRALICFIVNRKVWAHVD